MKFYSPFVISALLGVVPMLAPAQSGRAPWAMYSGDMMHTNQSVVPSQSMRRVLWSTPVDLNPQYTGGGSLLAHYGTPLITWGNTILVPVKTGASDGFQIEARDGSTGLLKYILKTDYTVVTGSSWFPSFCPALGTDGSLFVPAKGGTLIQKPRPDEKRWPASRKCFFGLSNYKADKVNYDQNVKISTPMTVDNRGNVWFGFRTYGSFADVTAIGAAVLKSGIAKYTAGGGGQWKACDTMVPGDSTAVRIQFQCAPAISPDGGTVYFVVQRASGGGYLVGLNSYTLATRFYRRLYDPDTGNDAIISSQSSSSVTVAPDGTVFFGILSNPHAQHNGRGYMLHFSADLSTQYPSGSFGWDITPAIIPTQTVPGYYGSSPYLIMTKYNNYAGFGSGTGENKVAILDPYATETDFISGKPVMKVIHDQLGPTADPHHVSPTYPNAVWEWCVNATAYDPFTSSLIVNSEDGYVYRWDLRTNTLSEAVKLDRALGQAYTPTMVGPTGIVYAINNAQLFAVGS